MGAGEAGGFAAKLEDADVAAKRVFALIDRVPEINPLMLGGKSQLGDEDLTLDFSDVKFNYPARPDATVLDHLSTQFAGNTSYGLMGKTGCGKSTIIQLMARFYDPNHGEVQINGDDLKKFDLKFWRSQLSIVMQEPALFSGTVLDNIVYGIDGNPSMDEVERVAKLAQIHEDIIKMPAQYDTPVGYRGSQLSGGQKQRVAIARALLRKPKILLLDEATSALDNATEAAVQQGINQAVKDHPMMIVSIAHRLTTIKDSDKILLLEEGSIWEEGSHDELMALNGEYRSRWELYNSSTS